MNLSRFALLPLLVKASWLRDVEDPARNLCSNSVGDGCSNDSQCCGDLECLGWVNWECGHTYGLDGEYCDPFYPCDEDFLCQKGLCTDYADLLQNGTRGTCSMDGDTNINTLKMMTYNVFLVDCAMGLVTCESENLRAIRVPKLLEWFKGRDEDVVVMQEVFSFKDEIIEGMTDAGFCHYVMNFQGILGSGLAIFSKWPIESFDFVDFFDLTGNGDHPGFNPEAFADKGVMHAKVNKGGKIYHAINTHTQSDSLGDGHEIRMVQYVRLREFVEDLNIPVAEIVLMGGDFNEDQWHHGGKYYRTMLEEITADEVQMRGPIKYTQNTEKNKLLKGLHEGSAKWETYNETLDFIFPYHNGAHKTPDDTSFCEILIPQWPAGCDNTECMLSDHFPMTCNFYTDGYSNDDGHSDDSKDDQLIADGDACQQDSECVSDHCKSSICRAKLASGEACGSSHHTNKDCLSGECSLIRKPGSYIRFEWISE